MEILIVLIIIIGIIIYYNTKKTGNPTNTLDVGVKNIQKTYSKIITKNYLTSGIWLLDNNTADILYTFRNNGELLITTNGIVEKSNYEFIVDNNSIIITKDGISKMFILENSKDDYLILKDLNKNEVMMFYNQTKIKNQYIQEKSKIFKTEKEAENRRKSDDRFKYDEMINSTLMIDLENERLITIRISNHPDGLFGVINNYKNEDKSESQILQDFKNWSDGNEHLTLINYIYFLDENYTYNYK